MVMGKIEETVKHKVFGGWAFYPIVFKNKKYVIIIVGNYHTYYTVNIYTYRTEKSFFKGYKGKKILTTAYSYFEYQTKALVAGIPHINQHIVTSIYSSDFEKHYPHILKSILENSEKELAEKEAEEKMRKENDEWDGVIQ